MATSIFEVVGALCIALAIVGCIYAVAATFVVRRIVAADRKTVAGFFVSIVSWRGRRFRVRSDGTLVAIGGPKA